jgi:Methyltransferase domain
VSCKRWDKYRPQPDSSCAVAAKAGRLASARPYYLSSLASYLAEQGVRDGGICWAGAPLWPDRHPVLQRLLQIGRQPARKAAELLKRLVRRTLPPSVRRRLRETWQGCGGHPEIGAARLGDLRRVTPFSRRFGSDRGLPVDRYYIERFLVAHHDVRGRVLEIKDDYYTRRFGGDRVTRSEVLHVVPDNPRATIVADLTDADHIQSEAFDCIILTQVLPFIRDPRAAVRTLHRVLAPGGIVLATVPGICQIDRHEMDRWGDYWRFTSLSARVLFEDVFAAQLVSVETYGNVLAAVALLYGLASTELHQKELDHRDPDYEVVIAVRAGKPIR